jgi:hypothetical protein
MDSRFDFTETWLTEAPEGIGETELIDMMEYNISDQLKSGAEKIALGSGFYKTQGVNTVYYWYESAGKIQLAAEFSVRPQALVVNAVGKRNKSQPPYASDLYLRVLDDRKKVSGSVNNIRLLSDRTLSDAGLRIWKTLLAQGHRISVYDTQTPDSLIEIKTESDLVKFFQDDNRDFRRWQYVLSESAAYLETRAFFNTWRMRKLAGML